jgi:hypothetical protein
MMPEMVQVVPQPQFTGSRALVRLVSEFPVAAQAFSKHPIAIGQGNHYSWQCRLFYAMSTTAVPTLR